MSERLLSVFRGLLPGGNRKEDSDVRVGMIYARMISGNVTETAEVSEVLTDGSGIPHIRFTLWLRDQNGLHEEGTRMLSQASFLRTYHKLK